MKKPTILFLILLFLYSACDTISGPDVKSESKSEKPAQEFIPPNLSSPENGADSLNTSVIFKWEGVSEVSSYDIQVSIHDDFTVLATDSTVQSNYYEITGLQPDTTYYWRVNSESQSEWSQVWSFSTAAKSNSDTTTTITAPELKAPENDAQNQSITTELNWKSVAGANKYQVQIAGKEDFSSINTDTIVTGATSVKAESLVNNETYYWRVRSFVDNRQSDWSQAWRFATESEQVSAPAVPALQSPENNSTDQPVDPTLAWSSAAGADSYHLQVSDSEDFSSKTTEEETTETSHQLSELEYDKTYYWKVRGINQSGAGDWSDTRNFTTEPAPEPPSDGTSSDEMWVSAYLASWNHYVEPTGNWGNLPTDEIDWDAFTHLFYFALNVKADGSLSSIADYENMSPDRINAIISAAHKENKPVIITLGGWGNYDGFSQAITPGVRSVLIANIVSLIETWGFDGVDLDMEPIQTGDYENYKAFVRELHTAFETINTPVSGEPLLTAATSWSPSLFSDLQDYFDQINLMTYDFSGAWEGWVSWHNSGIYSDGLTFPGSNKPLPSIENKVKTFVDAGIPKSKIGIGIDFYGYVWSGGSGTSTGGVTKPNQSWSSPPGVTDNVPYHEIMDQYYQSDYYRWDDGAHAAYLSIDRSEDGDDRFVSYDDEQSVEAKIEYIRQNNLGGVIIWELSGGYQKDKPSGQRDLLLQSVKKSVGY